MTFFFPRTIMRSILGGLLGYPSDGDGHGTSANATATTGGGGVGRSKNGTLGFGNDIFSAGVGLMLFGTVARYIQERIMSVMAALSAQSDVTVDGETEAYSFIAEYMAENPDKVYLMLGPIESLFMWLQDFWLFLVWPFVGIAREEADASERGRAKGIRSGVGMYRFRRLAPVRSFVCRSTYEQDPKTLSSMLDQSATKPRLFYVPNDGLYVVEFEGGIVHVVSAKKKDRNDQIGESADQLAAVFSRGGGGKGGRGLSSGRRNDGTGDAEDDQKLFRIVVPGSSDKAAREFIKFTLDAHFARVGNKTNVFVASDNRMRFSWVKVSARTKRTLESIVLRHNLKEEILEDIRAFLDSEQWYQDRGIPYRRGYILYGPPGCGKTSSIFAIASAMEMNVCIANLSNSSMRDTDLSNLLVNSPKRSILLFEDVDVALSTAVSGTSQPSARETWGTGVGGAVAGAGGGGGGITLSGLLNALDGIAAQEGRIVFLTTNSITSLPAALLRPGRCDRRFVFDYVDEDMIARLFVRFFGDELGDGLAMQVGREIAERIPEDVALSPAQLQGLFIRHRADPLGIIDRIDEFVEEVKMHRVEDEEAREAALEAKRARAVRDAERKGKFGGRGREATSEGPRGWVPMPSPSATWDVIARHLLAPGLVASGLIVAAFAAVAMAIRYIFLATCLDATATPPRPFSSDAVVFGFCVILVGRYAWPQTNAINTIVFSPLVSFHIISAAFLVAVVLTWILRPELTPVEFVYGVVTPVAYILALPCCYVFDWRADKPWRANVVGLLTGSMAFLLLNHFDMSCGALILVVANKLNSVADIRTIFGLQFDLNAIYEILVKGIGFPVLNFAADRLWNLVYNLEARGNPISRAEEIKILGTNVSTQKHLLWIKSQSQSN
ncbi:mitochondrial chaperone [Irineochytrium annulatum]|nr:mitochondrial chaperone [Irineochytrium annulatum]